MRIKSLLLLVSFILLLLVSACSGAASTEASGASANEAAVDGHMEEDMHDDEAAMDHITHVDAPDQFASLENPFIGDHEAIEAGEETFNTLCATCHGPQGKGDGPGAAGLDPKPADLGDSAMMGDLSDGYLFWRVSKGGAMDPFNSAMPAWEEGLTEEQR